MTKNCAVLPPVAGSIQYSHLKWPITEWSGYPLTLIVAPESIFFTLRSDTFLAVPRFIRCKTQCLIGHPFLESAYSAKRRTPSFVKRMSLKAFQAAEDRQTLVNGNRTFGGITVTT